MSLSTSNKSIVVLDAEMHRTVRSTLDVKRGEQETDLLLVAANHNPPVVTLSASLKNACQEAHGAYVINQHGDGLLLKAAASTLVVSQPPSATNPLPSLAHLPGDTADVNLLHAYQIGLSRTTDRSFRGQSGQAEFCIVWVDESTESARDETDYATIISSQIRALRESAKSLPGWALTFACVCDSELSIDGPLVCMMQEQNVRVYKSYQSMVDSRFGIELQSHDQTSRLSIHLAHKNTPHNHLMFHDGKDFDTYMETLATHPRYSPIHHTVVAASDPLDATPTPAALKSLRISVSNKDANPVPIRVAFIANHPDIDKLSTTLVFSSDRRMEHMKILTSAKTLSTCPRNVSQVIDTLLSIRRRDTCPKRRIAAFMLYAQSIATWEDALETELPDMEQCDRDVVMRIVVDLIQRTSNLLREPVLRLLKYKPPPGSIEHAPHMPMLCPSVPLPTPTRMRQASLALHSGV
jgi:hypothetical protein